MPCNVKLRLSPLSDSLVFCFLNLKSWDFTDGVKISATEFWKAHRNLCRNFFLCR